MVLGLMAKVLLSLCRLLGSISLSLANQSRPHCSKSLHLSCHRRNSRCASTEYTRFRENLRDGFGILDEGIREGKRIAVYDHVVYILKKEIFGSTGKGQWSGMVSHRGYYMLAILSSRRRMCFHHDVSISMSLSGIPLLVR
jgi:hypothetical protein